MFDKLTSRHPIFDGLHNRIVALVVVTLLAVSVTLTGGIARASEELEFVSPSRSTLSGLVDIEVNAPADTTAVRFSMDGVAFAEVTDVYTEASGLRTYWRTATDASWFEPGRHTLRAEAVLPSGTVVTAETEVVTRRPRADAGVRSLNGGWRFATASELPAGALNGTVPAVAQAGFDDSEMSRVLVPSSYGAIRAKWNKHAGQRVAYRRTADLPEARKRDHTWLVFESCYFECRYFVNGEPVGQSRGGYLPVRLDVSDAVRPGADTVAVVVDNRLSTIQEYGIETRLYWQWGGLLQGVRIERTAPVQMHDVTAVGSASGELTLRARAVNATERPATIHARVSVRGPDRSRELRTVPVEFSVPAGGGESEPVTLRLGDPQLWNMDNPALYTVEVRTRSGHMATTRTGFRTVRTDGPHLILNGERIENLRGINRHADYPGLGRTTPDGLAYRELEQLHDRGFRIFRPGHYPTTPAMLQAADELGMLVIEEINVHQASADQLSSQKVRDFAKSQLRGMITRDRGHPSVIIWSVGNENHTETTAGARYVRDLIAYGKKLDDTRLYTHVSAWHGADKSYAYQDIVLANIYAGTYYGAISDVVDYLDETQRAAGGKPVIIGEYGVETVPGREGYGPGTEAYQALMVDEYNRLLEARPGTTGWMYWPSDDFWVSPTWSGGNPDPTPPFHMKALRTFYREPKLGWKVMFTPVRIQPLPAVSAPPEGLRTATLRVKLNGIGDEPASGHLVINPPPGVTVEKADLSFTVEPGRTTTVKVPLSGEIAPYADDAVGTVRAVIDKDTEAAPKTFSFVPSAGSAHLALDAGSSDSPVLNGYERLAASTDWNPARGYGWVSEHRPTERDRGVPDALRRDLVGDPDPATLRVTIPPGEHTLRVLAGDTTYATQSMVVSVGGERLLALPDELAAGEFQWLSATIDGGTHGRQVDLEFSQTQDWWKFAALTIDQGVSCRPRSSRAVIQTSI